MSLLLLFWLVIFPTDSESFNVDGFKKRERRIVGGTKVQSRKLYSFQASVRYRGVHVCGGALVHPRFVLTAAHCSFNKERVLDLEDLSIIVGDLTVYETNMATVKRNVLKRYQHPRYFSTLILNDISLLEIEEPLETSIFIKAINISNSNPTPGTTCKVSGWGLTKEEEKILVATPNLMEIEIKMLPFEKCSTLFSWLSFDNSKLCGYSNKGCPNLGDSGGPLICDGQLSGVISFGKMYRCAKAANCFTSTFYHYKWIQYVILKSEYNSNFRDDFSIRIIDIFEFVLQLLRSLPIFGFLLAS